MGEWTVVYGWGVSIAGIGRVARGARGVGGSHEHWWLHGWGGSSITAPRGRGISSVAMSIHRLAKRVLHLGPVGCREEGSGHVQPPEHSNMKPAPLTLVELVDLHVRNQLFDFLYDLQGGGEVGEEGGGEVREEGGGEVREEGGTAVTVLMASLTPSLTDDLECSSDSWFQIWITF